MQNFLVNKKIKEQKLRQSNTFNYFKITFLQQKEIPPILTHWIQPYLSSFYLGIRKKDESEYEPNYLKNIQHSLEKHLRKQNYPKSITEDNEF